MRALFRQRLLLVRMRVAVKNSVHGQLFRLGLVLDEETSDLFSAKGRRALAALELDAHERWLLDGKLSTVDDLTSQIDRLERVIRKQLKEDGRAEILQSLPGVAELTAYAMLAEIGELKRFANGRALAAYAGVLPLDRESAEKDFGKRTNRSCNRYLRWAMLEAVSGAVRKSRRMRSLAARVRAKNRKTPGKARVAVARELLELAHLLLSRGELYQEDRPSRPGSRGRGDCRTSRPNRASQAPLCARPAVADQAAL
jgi:transposase